MDRKSPDERNFCCEICSKSFSTLLDFEIHQSTHLGERQNQYNYFEQSFKEAGHLESHEKFHTEERPHQCNYCERSFDFKSALKIHERVHTGERPYQCSSCERRFSRADALKTHERIHTGERPYQCSYCEKCFSHSSDLKIHERIHTGERPYKCNYCERTFISSSLRLQHERTHTRVRSPPLNYCEQNFYQAGILKSPERIPTGDKPYVCEKSQLTLTDSSRFHNHQERYPTMEETITNLEKTEMNPHNALEQCNSAENMMIDDDHAGSQPSDGGQFQSETTRTGVIENPQNISEDGSLIRCIKCSYTCNDEYELSLHYLIHFGKHQ